MTGTVVSCIHFVGGEKGGVGKSVFARLLCQWFVDHSAKFAALDADAAQGALLSSYGGSCQAVDLSVFESADQIMDRALGASRDVVVDLPAHSHRELVRWLRESDVVAFAEDMGVRLVFWLVTDGSVASIATLETIASEFAASGEVVLVRNQRWAHDSSELETSGLVRELTRRGGRMIELPLLDPALVSKWESGRNGPGLALRESPSGAHALTPMERQRMARWLSQGYAEVEAILRPAAASRAEPAQAEPAQVASVAVASAESAPSEGEGAVESVAEPGAAPGPSEGEASAASLESPAVPHSGSAQPAVGTDRITGARTWTKVGDGYQIYHVRY